MMILDWFNSREVVDIGAGLADQFTHDTDPGEKVPNPGENANTALDSALQKLFRTLDGDLRTQRLNVYKRARFANSFKWRLTENGVDGETADQVTRRLLIHLAMNGTDAARKHHESTAPTDKPAVASARQLRAQGNNCISRGAYAEAIPFYENLLGLDPRDVAAHNNLGAALCKTGRFKEAERHFAEAIRIAPDFPDPHSNLGNLFRWRGQISASEYSLRRALKLNPRLVDARVNLGLSLALLGRTRQAKTQLEKALKAAPRNADALCGLGFVARIEGRFEKASAFYKRALAIRPKMSSAWAAQVGIRKMTPVDSPWLEGAENIADGEIGLLDEVELRFAMGKYCDDVGNYKRAFENYKRANDLLKSIAEPYDREGRIKLVDRLIRGYTREAVTRKDTATCGSEKPVFVVGMPRSGTSLAEQIIASHPSAVGAGELDFWSDAARSHSMAIRDGQLDESIRQELADGYLRLLKNASDDALRIVDKTTINADYLGLIHSIFPNARILYLQRDSIDTCLSCYFQQFSLGLCFTMDLSDLAHYYREHRRLMAHWRSVLPPGTILDIPYAELVADQAGWTRKILEFLGLGWDERCLDFEKTERAVVTSSSWQVRQKIYKDSVLRWRNYEQFIGPLLSLRSLDS